MHGNRVVLPFIVNLFFVMVFSLAIIADGELIQMGVEH